MATEQTARLEARLPAEVYETLKRAAQLKGRSITDFVVSAAHEAAQRTIEESEIIRLSAEDQRRFAEALINPPEPNEALQRAARLHAENVEVRRHASFPKRLENRIAPRSRAAMTVSMRISATSSRRT